MRKKLILGGVGLIIINFVAIWGIDSLFSGSSEHRSIQQYTALLFLLVLFISFFLIWKGILYNTSLPKWAKILLIFVLAGITSGISLALVIGLGMAYG